MRYPFRRYQVSSSSMFGYSSPAVELEPLNEPSPVERSLDRLNLLRHHHQRAEQIMQFVLIAHVGPALIPQLGNRGWIKPARFAQQFSRGVRIVRVRRQFLIVCPRLHQHGRVLHGA